MRFRLALFPQAARALLLLIHLALGCGLSAGTLNVKVLPPPGGQGSVIVVPIQVQGATDLGGVRMELAFDPNVLQALGAEKGALAGGNSLLETDQGQPGLLRLSWSCPEPVQGDGTLIHARFKVLGSGGAHCQVDVASARAWASADRTEIPVNSQGGRFTASGIPGMLLLLAVLGVLLLAVLILVAVLLLRILRKKEPPNPHPMHHSHAHLATYPSGIPMVMPPAVPSAPPMPWLLRDPQNRSMPIQGPFITLGSAVDNTLVLSFPEISRHHARLNLTPEGGLWIEDLGSTNGTYVDGLRIQTAWLQRGAHLQLGSWQARIE